MNDVVLLSLQIGKKQTIRKKAEDVFKKEFETAFFKKAIHEEIFADELGFHGDEVADAKNHGGKEKAIFANSFENYPVWKNFLQRQELPFGALGENLTISGLDENSVCVGDIHKVGSLVLQVSQPRKPCSKISKVWHTKNFTQEIFKSGKTGWYYRVLENGFAMSGQKIEILQKGQISIQEINTMFYNPRNADSEALKNFFSIKTITPSWHDDMKKRIAGNYNAAYMEIDGG